MADELSGFDERMRSDLESRYEKLMKILDDACESEHEVRVWRACDKCGCQHAHYVKVPNHAVALKAAEWFANRGLGRPAQKDEKDDQSVTLIRQAVPPAA